MKRILTAAALAAALLSSAPRAAAACPYKVGPLGRRVLSSVQRGGVQQRGRRCKVQAMAGVSCPARGGVLSPSPI